MGRPVPEFAKEALDEVYMNAALRPLVRDRFGGSFVIDRVSAEPCGRRALFYTISLRDGDGGGLSLWRIVAKTYETSEIGRQGFEAMRRLWERGFAHQTPARVRIPQPFLYLASLRLLLMEEAPGRPLKKLMKKGLATAEHMRFLADALVKLHRFPPIFQKPLTADDHLAIRCASLAETLASAFPEAGPAIRWVVETAKDMQTRAGLEVFTLAHGDFHLGQAHINNEELWIIDLDPLHYGDPAYDLAMLFVAFKQLEAKTAQGSYIRSLRDAFLSAYFTEMDWEIAGRIPLQEALIHLKRACKRFRWQDEDGWRELIPRQIRQSITCLEAMLEGKTPRSLADIVDLYERCPGSV